MFPAGGCFGSGVWLAEFDLLGPSRKRLGTCPMKLSDVTPCQHVCESTSAACKRARRVSGEGIEKRCLNDLVQTRVVWGIGHGVLNSSRMASNSPLLVRAFSMKGEGQHGPLRVPWGFAEWKWPLVTFSHTVTQCLTEVAYRKRVCFSSI